MQLAPTGHGAAPLASHTPAAQGLRKRVGMGKHRRFKSWNPPQLQIVMAVFHLKPFKHYYSDLSFLTTSDIPHHQQREYQTFPLSSILPQLIAKHGPLLNLLAMPVTLCQGRQSGSNIQKNNFLLTHVILVGVTCSSSIQKSAAIKYMLPTLKHVHQLQSDSKFQTSRLMSEPFLRHHIQKPYVTHKCRLELL